MFMFVLIWTLVILLWIWLKRDKHNDEPPSYVSYKWKELFRITQDGESFWNLIKRMSAECLKRDGVMKLSLGPRTVYVISDPEDCLTLSNACLEKDSVYDFAKAWLRNGLVTASVPVWKGHRKLLNPLFGISQLNNSMDLLNKHSREFVKSLQVEVGNGPFNHYVYTRRYAMELMCMTSFGNKFIKNIDYKNKFMDGVEEIFNIYLSRINFFLFHNNFIYSFSSLKRKEDKCIEIMDGITSTIFKETKTSFNDKESSNTEEIYLEGSEFKPLIEVLLKKFANSKEFTDDDIRQHLDTFVAAGEDTTAGAIMFCLLLVGSYPLVQEEIHKELEIIFGNDGRDVTKEDLSKLVYLEAVISEAMRFYPVVPAIVRYVDKKVQLRNCTLSKGHTAIILIYGIHRHSIWGENAEEFRPERWLDPLSNCKKIFAGFSLGRRICIGKTMISAALKITMVHIFRNYVIHGDHTNMKLKFAVTLKAVSGHYITIERRKKNILKL